MNAVYDQYAQEMHEQFGFLACWLPSARVSLGDVGVLVGHRFEKRTTLAKLGIKFSVDSKGNKADIDYTSAKAVNIAPGAQTKVGDVFETALTIGFGRSGATFFQASDAYERTIADLDALEMDLRGQRQQGKWSTDRIVVTTVLQTGPAVIFVSNERGAKVGLRLRTDVSGGPAQIVRAAANLDITARSKLAASVVAPDGATPLFRAVQLQKKKLGGGTKLKYYATNVQFRLVPVRWPDLAAVPEPLK